MRMRHKPSGYCESFSLTLENGGMLFVDGCRSIIKYESDCIKLRLKCKTLCVLGQGLTLKSFCQRELCICGKISSLVLEDRQ